MKNLIKSSVLLVVFSIAMVFTATPVKADSNENFDLTVKHNINGKALGLSKELPVKVYVNGNETFEFEFKDIFEASLPAGNYLIEVVSVELGATVIKLQTGDIPAGVVVMLKAQLSGGKTPSLKVMVK